MWQSVPLPYICERLICFSIPVSDEFWILSYEGLHRVTIAPTISVSTDRSYAGDLDIWNAEDGELLVVGDGFHKALGLAGGHPIHELPGSERLEVDPDTKILAVADPTRQHVQELGFFDEAEDWTHATFSTDGRYVVVGTPNSLTIYRCSNP